MNDRRSLWIAGQIISLALFAGIAVFYGFWIGFAVSYSVSVLVDIRAEVTR